jgi:tRNA(fMet)-specific endonuclease VapC
MTQYLLDTDTVSQLIRGHNAKLMAKAKGLKAQQAALSVVSRGELAFGISLKPMSAAFMHNFEAVLGALPVLPLPEEAAQHYGDIRSHLRQLGQPIGPNDLWIAAHARALGYTLVSHNLREMSRVPKLRVESWL